MRIESLGQSPTDSVQDKKLKQACQDFEAVMMGFMLKGMRQTVQKSNLFGSSKEEDMFRDMMDDEMCKAASKRGTMGIAELLYKQLQQTDSIKRGETR